MMQLLYKDESYEIVDALYEVYNEKVPGFVEAVYNKYLNLEFKLHKTPAVSEPLLEMDYKGHSLKNKHRPDLICYEKIIIELKALTGEHRVQVLNYLKATSSKLGTLVNFSISKELHYERIVL